jgi:hypothetical protein
MPASFKAHVRMCSDGKEHERLDADFGEAAIGRVAPVSGRRLVQTGVVPSPCGPPSKFLVVDCLSILYRVAVVQSKRFLALHSRSKGVSGSFFER